MLTVHTPLRPIYSIHDAHRNFEANELYIGWKWGSEKKTLAKAKFAIVASNSRTSRSSDDIQGAFHIRAKKPI